MRTLREGRRQFLWRKTIPLICLVSSKSRKSTFMNAYHLQILPPHMLAQGFLKKPFNGFLRAFALLSGEHAKTVKNPRKNDCFKVVKSLPCDDFFAGLLKQTKITAPLGLQISKIGGRFRLSRDLEIQTHICGGGNATLWYTKDSSFSSSWILRIGGVGIVRAISKPFCKLRKPLEWNIHQNPNFNLQIRAIFQIQNWQF